MSLTEAGLRTAFAKQYRGRNWRLKCQAAVAQACRMTGDSNVYYYGTAGDGRRASGPLNRDPKKAPAGAIHFFSSGGTAEHVAGGLGGSRVFMASSYVDIVWGDHLGVTTVERYVKRTGCTYYGWAKTEGPNVLAITVPKPAPVKPATGAAAKQQASTRKVADFLNHQHLGAVPHTTASKDGKVDRSGKVEQVYTDRLQRYAKAHGQYAGKLDKKWGPLTQRAENWLAKRIGA